MRSRCCYCRRVLEAPTSRSRVAYTRDHLHPKWLGGQRTVPCCRQCNQLKGGMPLAAWQAFMDENPGWWRDLRYQRGEVVRGQWPQTGRRFVLADVDFGRFPAWWMRAVVGAEDIWG